MALPVPLPSREPAVVIGTVTSVVTAVLALVVAFGLELTDDQRNAILGVVGAAAPIVAALLVRPKVTPVADPRILAPVP
jgi:hypothetical protein